MPNLGPNPVFAAVALGSNLGDRRAFMDNAVAGLAALDRTELVAASRFRETEPVGPIAQGRYLNAAVLLRTNLPARALLHELHRLEAAAGRERSAGVKWGPRTLDLDLLVYGGEIMAEPGLTLPHPRMTERTFVLEPLAEIAPWLEIPGRGTVAAALAALRARGPSPWPSA